VRLSAAIQQLWLTVILPYRHSAGLVFRYEARPSRGGLLAVPDRRLRNSAALWIFTVPSPSFSFRAIASKPRADRNEKKMPPILFGRISLLCAEYEPSVNFSRSNIQADRRRSSLC
jgi:hypothetical protein